MILITIIIVYLQLGMLTDVKRFADFTATVPINTDDRYSVVCIVEDADSMATLLSSDVIV